MLIQLLGTGLLVAMLPLLLVWTSHHVNRYRKLIVVTLFFTFDLVVFGAFTRLTDSGLGCPDWPGCYGQANPFLAHADIVAAETLMPTGPVTLTKAWIEMIHRYLAMGVGVLIMAMMFSAWRIWLRQRYTLRTVTPWLPTGLFLLVCVQGAFGAWTVTLKLQPIIVSIHLMLGLFLLGLLAYLYASQTDNAHVVPITKKVRAIIFVALLCLIVQIALGAWVSTNYAAVACFDFPLCDGAWIPALDFNHGFSVWRHLGKTMDGDYLPLSALTTIHWVHRAFAVFAAGSIFCVAYGVFRTQGYQKIATWLFIVIALQLVSGVITVWFGLPLLSAVMHSAGAALLVCLFSILIAMQTTK